MNDDALKSMYGAGHVDATRTRECVAMPGKREQTIFTPANILDVVRQHCPGGRIAFDPCHGEPQMSAKLTASGRRAKRAGQITGKEDPETLVSFRHAEWHRFESLVDAVRRTSTEGLTMTWCDWSFVNPPYGTLREWLEKSMASDAAHFMLVPTRPHRVWWREWARRTPSGGMIYLNPVRFHGQDQAAPFPLVLAGRNLPTAQGRLNDLCRTAGIGEAI
jgi:hypothetical protein